MQFFLIFLTLITFLVSGCMETPEVSSSKKVIAQKQIEINQSEAQKAKEEYSQLQKQRTYE